MAESEGSLTLGFIKVLEELNIRPSAISGSSAGALVGAFYACGYTPDEILDFFLKTPFVDLSCYGFHVPGLINSNKYKHHLNKHLEDRTFESLDIPLFICCSDMEAGEIRIFSEGHLLPPLVASAAVPMLFSPVEINGHWYSDGGIMDNLPVAPIKHNCDLILGSYVNPVSKISKKDLGYAYKVLWRAMELRMHAHATMKFQECDYLFQPLELRSINWLDSRKVLQAFEIGYEKALQEKDNILRTIERKIQKPKKL